jgi:hypothetical protein
VEALVKSRMESLVKSWLDYARQRAALLHTIESLLRKTDEKFQARDDARDLQMKELQRQFYRVVLSEKLRDQDGYKDLSPEKLLNAADSLLSKRVHNPSYACSVDMRTAEQERMYVSLRVTWHNLLKKAKVRAADNRGGPTNPYGRRGKSE